MNINAFRKYFVSGLSHLYDQGEAASIFEFVREEIFGRHNRDFNNESIVDSTREKLDGTLMRLLKHEPVQYIFNAAWFGDIKLYVDNSTLIPRPETEELCQLILKEYGNDPKYVLDIGTGSGCIPVFLACKRSSWHFMAIEISGDAIKVAKKNVDNHRLSDRIEIREMDILTEMPAVEYDIVVSNPPYISDSEIVGMHANVLDWEPHTALFTGTTDPLIFYKRINKWVLKQQVVPEIWLEINTALAEETKDVFHAFDVELIRDMSGNQRFLHAKKK